MLDSYWFSLVYLGIRKGVEMKKSQILNYLKIIESELTDAYNVTPDTSENSDTLYYIDNARDLIGELEDNINGKFDNVPMGPDGLPLNFPFGDN